MSHFESPYIISPAKQLSTLPPQLFISFSDSGIGGTKNTPFPVLKSLFDAALHLDTLSRLLALRPAHLGNLSRYNNARKYKVRN